MIHGLKKSIKSFDWHYSQVFRFNASYGFLILHVLSFELVSNGTRCCGSLRVWLRSLAEGCEAVRSLLHE